MAYLNIDFEPDSIELEVLSSLQPDLPAASHSRLIILSGQPHFSGTFPQAKVIFQDGHQALPLPKQLKVIVHDRQPIESQLGVLTLCRESEEAPYLFAAEIQCDPTQFDHAWHVFGREFEGALHVRLTVKPPENDPMGYGYYFDISKSFAWSLKSFQLTRKQSRNAT